MLAASPEHSESAWVVELPEVRPFHLLRSLDGGATWVQVSTISEAWSAATFEDRAVPSTAYPLYDFDLGE